jgi:DNA polymerase III psi subunit
MQLDPRQLSTLDEMGIPVWELRNQLISSSSTITVELDEQQIAANCFIVHDNENHTQQKQQLLTAMMAAIGVDINTAALVRPEQLHSLSALQLKNKLLFVFGKRFCTELLSEQKEFDGMTAQVHFLKDSSLGVVVIDELSELIHNPEKKQLAWQALKSAKMAVNRFN